MTRTAALFAACVLFFWMFLAADPLEQLGAADRFSPGRPDVQELALSYAALWRHGMAGNSPLYMPGFLAVAAAAWWWMHAKRPSRMCIEGAAVMFSAIAVATALVIAVDDRVIASFEQQFALRHDGAVPRPSMWSAIVAAYTLATWTIVVICCRQALEHRAWRPLWPIPLMTIGLVAIRAWTLDDVQRIWYERLWKGDPAAVATALAIPIVVVRMLRTGLTWSTRRAAVPARFERGDLR
jgi:hypothetical protein